MEYAQVSVKFPKELNDEIERFLDETGVYTNKSEFIKDATRRQLMQFNDEPGIAALRLERMLARAEGNPISDDELNARLDEFSERVDSEAAENAVERTQQEAGALTFAPESDESDAPPTSDQD